MYDKSKQMHVLGSVPQVELSLRNSRSQERSSSDSWQGFDKQREVFRGVLTGIPRIQIVRQARNWIEAVAPESPKMRFLSRLEEKSERTRRRYAQRLEAAAARIDRLFSWAEFLPADAPPLPVQHLAMRRKINEQNRADRTDREQK